MGLKAFLTIHLNKNRVWLYGEYEKWIWRLDGDIPMKGLSL